VAGLLEARLHERVVDVLEDYGDAGGGDRLGDLAAHRPGAHDGGFEHEHAWALLCCLGLREPSDTASSSASSVLDEGFHRQEPFTAGVWNGSALAKPRPLGGG